MHFLLSVWHRLVDIGIGQGLSQAQRRAVRSGNTIAWIAIFTLFFYSPYLAVFGLYHVLWVSVAGLLFLAAGLVLAWYGFHRFSRYWTVFSCNLIIFTYVLFSGGHLGNQKFFIMMAVIPIFLFLRENLFSMFFFIGLSLSLYITLHLLVVVNEPLVSVHRDMMLFFNYLTDFGLFGTLIVVIYYLVQSGLEAEDSILKEKKRSDDLLHSILPYTLADELRSSGKVAARHFEQASVLFTDFVGFTKLAEKMQPDELVRELDFCFSRFDDIAMRYDVEKLKTIGDSFMAAGGLPEPNPTHAVDVCLMALEIIRFMQDWEKQRRQDHKPVWDIRIGIHSGPVMAGIIGKYKFAYDVWGDTVNTASRLETSGRNGKINVSAATYELTRDFFTYRKRGKIKVKNKGPIEMYFLEGIKPELCLDKNRVDEGVLGLGKTSRAFIPNEAFWTHYQELKRSGGK